MNINNQFIDAVSSPAGIIAVFFGLLILLAILIRVIIYRGFRRRNAELELKEKTLEETINTEVSRRIHQAKQRLAGQWDEYHSARQKATKALQRIVDSAYKFKVKTLLAGTTVNNWQSKYDQLRKEKEAYAAISEKNKFSGAG